MKTKWRTKESMKKDIRKSLNNSGSFSAFLLQQAAKKYVAVLNSPANALGQNIDTDGRASHQILSDISEKYGNEQTQTAINAEFQRLADLITKKG